MDHDRAEHLRKTVTGIAMIAAPVCFAVADSVSPAWGTDGAEFLADATGATARVYAGMAIGLAGVVFLMGAFVGLAHLLHQRRPGMAFVGGAFGLVGSLTLAITTSITGLVLFEAAQPGRDSEAMTKFVDDLLFGSAMPVYLLTICTTIAGVIFAVGLNKAHVVARWSAVCLGVAAVIAPVGGASGIQPVMILADLVLLAGLGSIGWTVLAETDEEWAATPEFHGFGRNAVTA